MKNKEWILLGAATIALGTFLSIASPEWKIDSSDVNDYNSSTKEKVSNIVEWNRSKEYIQQPTSVDIDINQKYPQVKDNIHSLERNKKLTEEYNTLINKLRLSQAFYDNTWSVESLSDIIWDIKSVMEFYKNNKNEIINSYVWAPFGMNNNIQRTRYLKDYSTWSDSYTKNLEGKIILMEYWNSIESK